jgi:hypothetical protein
MLPVIAGDTFTMVVAGMGRSTLTAARLALVNCTMRPADQEFTNALM